MTAASLAEALLELQANLPTVAKRQVAKVETAKGSYSYRYAGLAAVMSAVLPRLNGLGLIFLARPTLVDGRAVLLAELVHVASGERLTAEYPLATAQGAPAQAVGSAISYGRRYCLTSMIGLVCEEDDDGRAASARYDEPDRRPSPRQEPEDEARESPTEVLERRKKRLFALYNEVGPTNREERLADLGEILGHPVTSSNELALNDVETAISALTKRKREMQKAARNA